MKLPKLIRDSITHRAGHSTMNFTGHLDTENVADGNNWWYIEKGKEELVLATMHIMAPDSVDQCYFAGDEGQHRWPVLRDQLNVVTFAKLYQRELDKLNNFAQS